MKYPLIFGSVALSVAISAGAQVVASHAPMNVPNATTQTNAAPVVTGKPVALVNGTALTDRDLLREMYAIFPYARVHDGFPKSMEANIRQGALDMIIFEELVYQEALRRHMSIPQARIDSAELQFKKQFQTREQYQQFLKAEMKGSRLVLRQKIRRSLLIEALQKNDLQLKSTVTEAEAKAYYDKNPARFEHGETFAIQTISFLPPEKNTPENLAEQKKRAEDAYAQGKAAKTYEEFGLLAEKLSEDDFRVNMGDHHEVGIEKLPPDVARVARTMKPGDVSPLLHLADAYSFFRLNAYHPAGKPKFTEVKKQLMPSLQKAKYDRLRSELATKLKKNSKVQVL